MFYVQMPTYVYMPIFSYTANIKNRLVFHNHAQIGFPAMVNKELCAWLGHTSTQHTVPNLTRYAASTWSAISAQVYFWSMQMVSGTVKNIAKFGAFVELSEGVEGLLHGSEISAAGEGWAWFARDHGGQEE